jgi:hypothetical protein
VPFGGPRRETLTEPIESSSIYRIIRAIPASVWKLVKAWLGWFWRLGPVAKIAVTAVEIVVLYLVATRLPLAGVHQQEVVAAGSLILAFLLIAGILFGRSSRS